MHIKAIPTKYGPIQYRSRTEARWAVFFDELNIDFHYEREGYQLKSGEWYVPDFWIPEAECWIEIKGVSEGHESHIRKLREVCVGTDTYGFVFVGPPSDMIGSGSFVGSDISDSGGGDYGGRFDAYIEYANRSTAMRFTVGNDCKRSFFNARMTEELMRVFPSETHKYFIEEEVWQAALTAKDKRFW